MKVFKFGGASIKDADSIRNVGQIINAYSNEGILVVVSAIGKTTNALEAVVSLHENKQPYESELNQIFEYHNQIARALILKPQEILDSISAYQIQIIDHLNKIHQTDKLYDQVVSIGELMSTLIVNAHLQDAGIKSQWLDARRYVITDSTFREGRVNWEETEKRIQNLLPLLRGNILVTQGFIGSEPDHFTTTLGREGSDFSAAIFGSCLNVESVTIWKDVPGVMSADPKRIPTATTFDELPFREAAEMTYYGASVIHPKTIKPLANKGINLYVKNFDNINLPGTRIHECVVLNLAPLIVFKDDQCLISCHVTDYTFIDESQIEFIFNALKSHGLRVNLMQNSAISFSFCLDFQESKVLPFIKALSAHFEVFYNTGLTLITIKNYDPVSFEKYRNKKGVILEQSSRSTLQVLLKSN